MTDLSMTVAPKSDQLNADDLISGPLTIQITRVSANPNSAEQPVSVYFRGDNNKPFKPCKSMRRVMIAIWGPDGSKYPGRSMTLYRDPKVTFGGMEVGGIRISHMTDMSENRPRTMALTASKTKRLPYTVTPLVLEDTAPSIDAVAVTQRARAVAKLGTRAFREYWNSPEGKAGRATLQPLINELRDLASQADAQQAQDDDPFGLPPVPEDDTLDDLTEEQRAELERVHQELDKDTASYAQ